MANNCRIPRKDVKSAPTRADLIAFAKENLIPALKAIYNNPKYYSNGVINPTKIKQAVAAHLQSLGRKYVPDEYQYIEEAINILTESTAFKFIKSMMPPGKVINLLTMRGKAEKVSAKVYTDNILDDTASEHDAVDFFLHNAFGSAILAKNQLERRMINIVLNSFVIDRADGNVVSSIQEATQKVLFYKKELLKDIITFFEHEGIKSGLLTADLDQMSADELIVKYKKDISKWLQVGVLSEEEIQTLYDDSTNSYLSEEIRNSAKVKLRAYGSWLALQHFDNFIKIAVGDTIIINPSSETDRYAYATKGTNVNTTWRKDDNYDLQAEVNKLTQALINTSPMFSFGSRIPTSDAYMQFSDFSYITAKIKDLVYDPQSSTIFVDQIPYIYRDLLTPEEKLLVKNKSLRHIISNSRYNPQKYLPLIYKIMTSGNSDTGYFIHKFKNFNKQDQNVLWSVFKNIYDSDFSGVDAEYKLHSLYSIQRENPNGKNYFAAVSSVADCIFSVDFTHYVYEDGVLKVKSLRDSAVGKTLMEIKDIINNKNSHELVKNFDFSYYGVTEIIEDSRLDGISFRLNVSSDPNKPDYVYVHVSKLGENIKFSKSENPKGKPLTTSELIALDDNPEVLKFFDEMLGLNITNNTDFKNTLKELMAQGTDSVSNYLNQMLAYTSHVFFNRYFSETYTTEAKTKSRKRSVIAKHFTSDETRPKFNNKFFGMEMTPPKKHTILETIAQALGTTRGLNSSRQVKDSDNAALSSQSLSRLLGNMAHQMDLQIKAYNRLRELEAEVMDMQAKMDASVDPGFIDRQSKLIEQKLAEIERFKRDSYLLDSTQNPAASSFDIITKSGLFLGVVKSEEIKGVNSNKKQVKFTTSEAVISSFLHNFVLGHCTVPPTERRFEFGNNIVGLLPSVNSDKTTVSIAKFDLNTVVEFTDPTTGKRVQKKYVNLTGSELRLVIMDQIGAYYNTMYANIKEDFSKISTIVATALGIEVDPDSELEALNNFVNPDDGFAALNNFIDAYN